MKVYVSGPVIRKGQVDSQLARFYPLLEAELESQGHSVSLPFLETEVDVLSDQDFFVEIDGRIDLADCFVGVLVDDHLSTVIETTMATMKGKPVVLVSLSDQFEIPRMLRCLPNIVGFGNSNEINRLAAQLLSVQPA